MNHFATLLLLLLFSVSALSQNDVTQDIQFGVFNSSARSINQGSLINARSISDIQPGFPSSWISSYVSMVIVTSYNGETMKAESKNDQLSDAQQGLLKKANAGTDINIEVLYYPESSSEVKKINYSYTVVPNIEAEFPGGNDQLYSYLMKSAIEKIPEGIAPIIPQTTIKFIIDEQGQVTDIRLSSTSQDENTDQILLQAIKNMPSWTPAQNANGQQVSQQFELNVGNVNGC